MMNYEMIYQQVKLMLRQETVRTREQIKNKAEMVLNMYRMSNTPVDVNIDELIRELESEYSIWNANHTELTNNEGHEPWLDNKKSQLSWGFWKRYETYLEQDKKMPTDTVLKVHDLTDSILGKLEDPKRIGPWDRRGMVVGQVQSGKTSNYTGLICKAADAGYKLIIVLAGLHKSLRSQTQYRLDEGFLGRDTQRERIFSMDSHRLGAGTIPSKEPLIAHSMTSSADNGDFKNNQVGGTTLGGDPVLVVVKKHKTILKNLLNWILSVRGEKHPETGKRIIRGIPLLLIDDEADNASVNTKNEDEDASAINASIRKILNSFEQRAYVGYTATPFANIFIYPNAEDEELGPDLFPKSFIINIPAPSNYIGPAQVFGLEEDTSLGINSVEGLPIIHTINDYESIIPNSHKGTLQIEELPESLHHAVKSFILSCAARLARGQESQHNSMLIHVTRFINVQNQIEELVKKELLLLQRRIENGDGKSKHRIMDELQTMWEAEYIPRTRKVAARLKDSSITELTWDDMKEYIYPAVMKIQVKRINGSAKDILDYVDHKNGLSVIAVGGDKLSRGLTLEGLTVSYYLRGSRMYDTLMQMGRWFGYRPGYVDLCRLYTSADLIEWYKHIASASEELRLDFEYMASSGRTPNDFGLKVRTHPAGMIVTGASKMKHGTTMEVTFADTLAETTVFHKNDTAIIEKNYLATEQFIRSLGAWERDKSSNYKWEGKDVSLVLDFLNSFVGHPDSRRSNPKKLKEYIEKQQEVQELTKWTVIIKSTQQGTPGELAGLPLGLTDRANDHGDKVDKTDQYKMIRNHLISPLDEGLDLNDEEMELALERTKEDRLKNGKQGEPTIPGGHFIRNIRNPEYGLLILYPLNPKNNISEQNLPYIGFAISFPGSDNAKAVEYLVNNIYWGEEFEEE
jgi:hypothetical protein